MELERFLKGLESSAQNLQKLINEVKTNSIDDELLENYIDSIQWNINYYNVTFKDKIENNDFSKRLKTAYDVHLEFKDELQKLGIEFDYGYED